MGENQQRMEAGEWFLPVDPQQLVDTRRRVALCAQYNNPPDALSPEQRDAILRELFGSMGEGVRIRSPFHCDFGRNIHIGARTFVNFGAVFLDTAPITIGADTQIGPNVQLLTPTHPLDPAARRAGWERGVPVTLGDNVWLGGGTIVCPGVTIGDDTVVGAGSVVVKDLPAGVLAVGNPARVVRSLGPAESGPGRPGEAEPHHP
ncbi:MULTISPECIES: sugar O-acetyltransferase [unclassified Streptomyces]|uniref:sugar O-acetyltransferase n=1 Tax=unclassified Streptomyces TaxID=2593676 RepID=UPI002E126BC4|nr:MULTISPECIES: sugar O-acetyltransferase [unclassified Streptomyces]WSR23209.1 sugar O-acetyltransferase [Streptomyces sp. NBC_01205]